MSLHLPKATHETGVKRGLVSITLAVLLFGCDLDGFVLKVRMQNDAPQTLTLVELGGAVRLVAPTTVGPGKQLTLSSKRLGYTTFIVEYQGKRFEGDSGYSDDYSEYQLVFDESNGSLTCRFIVSGFRNRPVDLAPVD